MKIAITGSHGFVGSHLVSHIRAAHAGDIQLTALTRQGFDLTSPDTWETLPHDIDCFIHAASLIDGPLYDVYAANALYIPALVSFLNRRGVGKFIYLSTGAVYGALSEPATPDMPENPSTAYPVSKYLAERNITDNFNGVVNILRLYFPYGTNLELPRLLPKLIQRIRQGETIYCNRDGGPWLSLVHVDDISEIIINDFALTPRPSGKWNIASDETVALRDIAERIAAALRVPLKISETGNAENVTSIPYVRQDGRPWRLFDVEDILG